MKQIVSTVSTIDFKDITNNSFVGIDWGCDHKVMVIRTDKDRFVGLSNCGYLNLIDCWETTTMQSYVAKATSQGDHVKAYEFKNMKELLTWLIPE